MVKKVMQIKNKNNRMDNNNSNKDVLNRVMLVLDNLVYHHHLLHKTPDQL